MYFDDPFHICWPPQCCAFSSHIHAVPHLCSLEVILRAEAVEMVQAGDKCDFIGTLIVVPDVSQLRTEGECWPLVITL